jgi:hypothetical protein
MKKPVSKMNYVFNELEADTVSKPGYIEAGHCGPKICGIKFRTKSCKSRKFKRGIKYR